MAKKAGVEASKARPGAKEEDRDVSLWKPDDLWITTDSGGVTSGWGKGEQEAGSTVDAGSRTTGEVQAEVPCHNTCK